MPAADSLKVAVLSVGPPIPPRPLRNMSGRRNEEKKAALNTVARDTSTTHAMTSPCCFFTVFSINALSHSPLPVPFFCHHFHTFIFATVLTRFHSFFLFLSSPRILKSFPLFFFFLSFSLFLSPLDFYILAYHPFSPRFHRYLTEPWPTAL